MRSWPPVLFVVLLAFALAGCGGGGHAHKSSSTKAPTNGKRLGSTDLPDVLSPGIWPGANLRAFRDGDTVTIKTSWRDSGTTVDGRTTQDAALSICGATFGDLNYNSALTIEVLAANGWEHLAFKDSGGTCHSG